MQTIFLCGAVCRSVLKAWTTTCVLLALHFQILALDLDFRPVGGLDIDGWSSALSGQTLYVHQSQGTGTNCLAVVDISNPATPILKGSCAVSEAIFSLAVVGEHVLAGTYETGLQIINVGNPNDPRVVGSVATNSTIVDIAATESIAYLATSTGILVVNFNNPASPKLLGVIDQGFDVKSLTLKDGFLYSVDDFGLNVIELGPSTLGVNIGLLGSPQSEMFDAVLHGNLAYVIDSESGILVADISNRMHPQIVASHKPSNSLGALFELGVSGDLLIASEIGAPPFRHLVFEGANTGNLSLVGTLLASNSPIAIAGKYVFFSDPGLTVAEMVPANPQRLGETESEVVDAMAIFGDLACSIGPPQGLNVYDLANGAAPVLLGNLPTTNHAYAMTMSATHAYIAVNGGVDIVDIRGPQAPRTIARLNGINEFPIKLAAVGNRLLWSRGRNLEVVDVTDPATPFTLGKLQIAGGVVGIATAGNIAYLLESNAGLRTIDLSDPQHPVSVGLFPKLPFSTPRAVAADGDRAFVLETGKFRAVDVSNSKRPLLLSELQLRGNSYTSITLADDVAYLAEAYGGLEVIDVRNPSAPQRLASNSSFGAYQMVGNSDHLWVATGRGRKLIALQPFRSARLSFMPVQFPPEKLELDGPAKVPFLLEQSEDLSTWEGIQPLTLGIGPFQIDLPHVQNGLRKFFRSRPVLVPER